MPKDARYVGSVVIEIDGVEIEALNFRYDHNTGRRRVNTMNKKGQSLGYAKGIATYDISLDVPVIIDDNEKIDWKNITAGKLTWWPLGKPNDRTTIKGFVVESANETSSPDGEMTCSITGFGFGEINE